ncbi:DUF4221 family protein [Parapedobacter koreensis]|uniref:6-bladed beta-propeller protein n=1 Tax=Parapedobacter koreensis TaxID=332977 RepID=A0A1H7RMI9_9SPHI|nr:DUF4221 family protein [Parapedobacter koreensis]SEL61441.1 protein of unknown function [Parapedobacter koreensis]
MLKYQLLLLWPFLLSQLSIPTSAQQLVKKNSYTFYLPKSSGFQPNASAVDLQRGEYLRTISLPRPSLEIYNLNDGKLKQRIPVQAQKLGAFVRVSDDRLWIFDSYKRRYLFVDSSGTIIKAVDEMDKEYDGELAATYPDWQFNPLTFYDGRIYCVSALFIYDQKVEPRSSRFQNQGMVRVFDTRSNHVSWAATNTIKSLKHNFGYINRYSYARAKDHLVISPAFSTELLVLNLKNNYHFYPDIKDTLYNELIQPIASWKKYISLKDPAILKHYYTNAQFVGIMYDHFRDRYYRFLILPKNRAGQHETKLIVLDKYLERLSTHTIPMRYRLDGAFIDEHGLNLLDYDKYLNNYDQLVFDTLLFE